MTKETTKSKINPTELKALKKVKDYRLVSESNIVSILWKKPELCFDYDNITLDSFLHNEWKVYFQIITDLVIKEKKYDIDEITIDLYLEKHKKLKDKYEAYGGFNTISKAKEYVKVTNIDGYIAELNKWKTVMTLSKNGFPIADRLSDYCDYSLEEIYEEFEALLNHTFINAESDKIRTYDISEGLDELISELNEGNAYGLEYYNMPMFNAETNGMTLGNFYLLCGSSGTGKSSFCRSLILPSILKEGEKICYIINEEDHKKTKSEMLVWVATNIFKMEFQKYKITRGNFSEEDMKILKQSKEWIEEHKEQIYIVAMDSFSTNKAIKIIKKYASLGFKYMIIDTFKHDSDMDASKGNTSWLELQQNATKLYDIIKPSNKNVCLVATVQLTKQSIKQRCLTIESIASAKNIADVASGCFMVRWVLPDEFKGEKHELKVFNKVGKNGKTNIPYELDSKKRYQLLFLGKNRFGSANEFAIVIEVDLSRNTYKEVGLTVVQPDW